MPVLRSTEFRSLAADGMASAYLRGSGAPGSVVVALNAGEEDAILDISLPSGQLDEVHLPGNPSTAPVAAAENGTLRLPLPPRTGRLFRIA